MGDFSELYLLSPAQAFNFFAMNWGDSGFPKNTTEDEQAYVVSIVAHYASVSLSSEGSDSQNVLCADLPAFFDRFVLTAATERLFARNPKLLPVAGSQALFLSGLSKESTKKNYKVSYFESLGKSYYLRAAENSTGKKEAMLFSSVAYHFPWWTTSLSDLFRYLREMPYIFNFDKGSQSS